MKCDKETSKDWNISEAERKRERERGRKREREIEIERKRARKRGFFTAIGIEHAHEKQFALFRKYMTNHEGPC